MTESAVIRLAGRKSGQCDITITQSFYYEVIQGELLQVGVAISVDTAYSTSVFGRAFRFADNFGFFTKIFKCCTTNARPERENNLTDESNICDDATADHTVSIRRNH